MQTRRRDLPLRIIMSGHFQTCRLRRRLALIGVFLVWETAAPSPVRGQSDQADATVAEVSVMPAQRFPVSQIDRRLAAKESGDPTASDALAFPAAASPKTTFVFSPIELGPIRPSKPPADLPLPPEISAQRDEIERRAMARIFAGGMINDIEKIVTQSEMQLVQRRRVASAASETAMTIAQTPQPAPSESNAAETPPQRRSREGEMIISDVLIETSILPEPPLVGDRIEELVKPGVPERFEGISPVDQQLPPLFATEPFQGMIEDDLPSPIMINNLPDIAPGSDIEMREQIPGERQLPGYTMPDGGLDIYMLAPTRFYRPLPNAR